jgi:hypothetical protein
MHAVDRVVRSAILRPPCSHLRMTLLLQQARHPEARAQPPKLAALGEIAE